MLKELTEQYIEAFNKKDLEAVGALMSKEFALEDPIVKGIEGLSNALEAIKGIFESCQKLSFSGKNIFQDGQTTIIEFVLNLDDTRLQGADIIKWQNGKMYELRAHLDVPKEEECK